MPSTASPGKRHRLPLYLPAHEGAAEEARPQPTQEEFRGHGERLPRGKQFRAEPSISTCDTRRTHLVGEPLRDRSSVECAVFAPSTQADHPIIVLNLAGIDVVHLFTVVLLTGPLGRAVVTDSLLDIRAPRTNRQGRFILIASGDDTLAAGLLRGHRFRRFRALLREHRG